MTAYDQMRAEAFADRMLGVLNGGAIALMTSVGHRTGLFDVLSELGSASAAAIALRARLDRDYVLAWLGAMVTGGVLDYDARTRRYSLPREHAAVLTRRAGVRDLSSLARLIPLLGAGEGAVLDGFRNGRGRLEHLRAALADERGRTLVLGLEDHILPLVPGLVAGLRSGIDVLDVGCGSGRVTNRLAALFPRSWFRGCDPSASSIAAARAAADAGPGNVTFAVCSAGGFGIAGKYDAVFAFELLAAARRPVAALARIRQVLRPGGVVLLRDLRVNRECHRNSRHPAAPLVYALSLPRRSGALRGREETLRLFRAAGFPRVNVRQLPHDVRHDYYVLALEKDGTG